LLFLARIHPKKGLPHLLDAWASVSREGRVAREDWLLVIAGPDQLGHAAEVRARAHALGLDKSVLFTGPLEGRAKWSALAAAEGFILPSFSEGFSAAVLEAMAFRVPVLVTRPCNFDAAAIGAGLVCGPNAASVAQQLRQFFEMPEPARRELGERGRVEIERTYNWTAIGRQLFAVCAWLVGGGVRPSCVDVTS